MKEQIKIEGVMLPEGIFSEKDLVDYMCAVYGIEDKDFLLSVIEYLQEQAIKPYLDNLFKITINLEIMEEEFKNKVVNYCKENDVSIASLVKRSGYTNVTHVMNYILEGKGNMTLRVAEKIIKTIDHDKAKN